MSPSSGATGAEGGPGGGGSSLGHGLRSVIGGTRLQFQVNSLCCRRFQTARMAGKLDRYDPWNDGQGLQATDSGDYGQQSGRAPGWAREPASHNSRAPTISKASPKGTMK